MDVPPLQPPDARRARRARGGLFQGMIGALIGGGVALAAHSLIRGWVPRLHLWYLGAAALSWVVTIVTHEVGHALAGRLVGFRFLALFLGPIRLSRESGSLRVGLSGAFALSGACVSAPIRWNGDASFRRSMFVLAVAGPLVNIVLGGLALQGGVALHIFAIISLATGLLSLGPRRGGGIETDGAQLLRTLRFSERGMRESLVRALAYLCLTTPPRKWPPELVANALSEVAGSDPTTAAGLVYWSALHAGDIATAGTMLQRQIDNAEGRQIAGAALEAAIFEGAWRRDAAQARAWLARASGMGPDPHGRLVAEAAIAFAENDRESSAAILRRAAATLRERVGGSVSPTLSLMLRQPTIARIAAPAR
jgi:hypothetical protein